MPAFSLNFYELGGRHLQGLSNLMEHTTLSSIPVAAFSVPYRRFDRPAENGEI